MLDICYYVTKYDDDVLYVKGCANDIRANEFFTDVSRIICFDDCNPVTVMEIIWHGKTVHYRGWAPGMHYMYDDDDGNLVWEGWFPEWDH